MEARRVAALTALILAAAFAGFVVRSDGQTLLHKAEWWQVILAAFGIGVLAWQAHLTRISADAAQVAATAAAKNTEALISSERAWVVAELVPISVKFSDGFWRRPVGTGWAALTEEELLGGVHLRHKLKFTNMGRTPAHILRYHISYSREAEVKEGEIHMIATTKRPEINFDRLLAGDESVEVAEIDISQYIRDSIVEIGDANATGILSGRVEYLHVFSDTEVVKVPFMYLYDPSLASLHRVPLTPKKDKKKD